MLNKTDKSVNTIISYKRNINKLVLFLDGAELSKEKMLLYKKSLKEKGFKNRTINVYLAAANYFCEIMGWQNMKVELESLDYEEMHKPMQISLTNYKKLIYTALQNDNERLAMMIQVLCHMDLRFCEMKFLTVDMLHNGFVEIKRKHNKIKVTIPDMLIEDLNIYIQHKNIISGVIFCTKNGSLVDRSNFLKDLKKICLMAGMKEDIRTIQQLKNVVLDSYPYYGLNN